LLLSLLASVLRGIPAGSAITFVVRAGLAVGLWLLLQHLLLGGRVRWQLLLPGATQRRGPAGDQPVLRLLMPNLIERNADRYGVIGVTFALLSWLTVLGIMLVAAAVMAQSLVGQNGPDSSRRQRPRRRSGSSQPIGRSDEPPWTAHPVPGRTAGCVAAPRSRLRDGITCCG
jgi:membrane protein